MSQDARVRVAVIVNGPPASGKSTLAGRLADALALPLLAKDVVKETLLDQLGYADRADSRRIGAASGEVLWTVLAGRPGGGRPGVLAGAAHPPRSPRGAGPRRRRPAGRGLVPLPARGGTSPLRGTGG